MLATMGITIPSVGQPRAYTITGHIYNRATNKPIAFASIYVVETEQGVVADVNGQYQLYTTLSNDIKIKVTGLGYSPRELTIQKGQRQMDIALNEQSITLKEFTVTAKYKDKLSSDATIDRAALEYIQPTSIQDVFQLLPGGKMGANNMQGRRLISSRQVGSDEVTSFGMGISINGIPVQNDGQRIQLSGMTGNGSVDREGNISVNTGVDLRTLSTDHIETITVGRGIASAKEGNLSSGSIRIVQKQGQSGLRARVKFDPLNKLAYLGKGFLLSEKLGTLYLGADIVRSSNSIDDVRGTYNRITTQANWNNQRRWWGKKTDMNISGSYITSFNNNKSDDVITMFNEKYNTHYQRLMLSVKLNMDLHTLLVDQLELLASTDYTSDVLRYNKHVENETIMPVPTSTEEGEHEGVYLPQSYDTYYKIDNKPLNTFIQLTGSKLGSFSERLTYTTLLGTSLTYTKNMGWGAVVDPLWPPYPSSDFIRPRVNKDVPAIGNQAGYIEGRLGYKGSKSEINVRIGLRETMMLNLPTTYALHGRMLWEPRLQLSYSLTTGKAFNTVRFGYGIENKLPSADFLYPDKIYHDFVALNAYFNEPEKRLLITNTRISDPTNAALRENKNRKFELGWDFRWHNYIFSVTAFYEQMNGGVEYFRYYKPASYTYYYELKHPVTQKPTREDFYSRTRSVFMSYLQPTNSAKTIKRGVEYRLHIPEISTLCSEIEINGAYYKTLYTAGVPVMHHPAILQYGETYDYVGIYNGYEKTYAESFNTNIWVNTRLPKLKLIFTNFVQIMWFENTRLGDDVDVYPSQYMDKDGQIHPFSPDMITSNPKFLLLKRDFLSARYRMLHKPISLRMNLKLSKEFSKAVKFSFFADNILQVSPKYRDNYLRSNRDWYRPFFGAELIVNVF